MRFGVLATEVSVFDELLGVIPGSTRVRQEHGHQDTRGDRAREVGAEGSHAQSEADGNRSEDGQQARRNQLAERITSNDVHDLPVLRLGRSVHDSGDLAELAPNFEDNGARGSGNSVNGQSREQEDNGRSDNQADQIRWGRDVENTQILQGISDIADGAADRRRRVLGGAEDRLPESTEQGRRSQNRGGDCDSLGDGLRGVADGVQAGQHGSAFTLHIAGHFRNALRVVRHWAEGVHRHDDAHGRQQTRSRESDREEAEADNAGPKQERSVHRGADDQRRVDGGLQAE